MKSNFLFILLGVSSLMFSVSSCFSPKDQEEIIDVDGEQSSELFITTGISSPWVATRASEEVPVPINYYLFDSIGQCVDHKVAETATTPTEFIVSRGAYQVYAVCGEVNDLPTQQTASLTDFYSLATDADVCMGNKTVNVTNYGSTKEEQINVNHVFSLINLSISSVPKTVTAISATIGNLYDAISLKAEYDGSQTVTKSMSISETDSTEWVLSNEFMYPTVGDSMSVTLAITSTDGATQTVNTTTTYVLKKGTKTSLSAAFQSLSTVSPGVVVENGWSEESGGLNFWESGNTGSSSTNNSSNNEPQNGGSSSTSGTSTSVYNVGEAFGNTKTIIYSVTNNADSTVTLGLIGSLVLKSVTLSNVTNKINTYNTNLGGTSAELGITWRVPSSEDIANLHQVFTKTSELATAMSEVNGTTQTITSTDLFLICLGNNYYQKEMLSGTSKSDATATEFLSLIPFATYTVTK